MSSTKRCARDGSQALTKIESTITSKLIKGSQNDQYRKYPVLEDLQGGGRQKFVALMVFDLVIL